MIKIDKMKDCTAINLLPTITYIPKAKRSRTLNYKIYFGWLLWHFYVE